MNLGLTRRNIGRLALLTWAIMLAWLARREFAKQGIAGLAERTRRLEPPPAPPSLRWPRARPASRYACGSTATRI